MPELSLVDQMVAEGNREPGEKDMLTPEQITAIEEQRVADAAAGRKDGEGEKQPTQEEQDRDVLLDEILAKAQADPTLGSLTDDEKAELILIKAELEANPPVVADDDKTTYTIAGRVFTAADIDAEMREKWLKGPNGEDINPSPERLVEIRKGFVKSRNREAAHVATVQQQEVNAAERQVLLQAKLLKQQDVDRDKADRERIRRDMEYERARAAVEVNEAKIQNEEGKIDLLEFTKAQRKIEATERLSRLEKDAVDSDARIAENERTLIVAEVSALIAMAPQYKMDGDVRAAFKTVSEGGTIDQESKLKVLELDQLVRDARSKGIPLEDEYAFQKARGTLAIKPTAQSAGPSKPPVLPGLPTNVGALTKMILDHRKRLAAAPPAAGGAGASRRVGDNRSDAHRLVDHDRQVLGEEKDEFLDTWKTGKHIVRK